MNTAIATTTTTNTVTLNPTDGHIIAGTVIDSKRFVGRMRAAQLFQLAPDPRDAENAKKRDDSRELTDLATVRSEVQRYFDGAKKANVKPYAAYIVGLTDGDPGITPPITLYTERALWIEERTDGTAMLQVPWDVKLVAIDGETQLAARYEAQNVNPDTAQDFVPVYICFGRPTGWARQAFHDLNTLAVRPNAAISMSMDSRDPVTSIVSAIEAEVPFFKGRVNRHRRQLRDSDTDVVTITGLRGAIATLAKGIGGIRYGSRPVPLGAEDFDRVKDSAIDWFRAVADAIGPQLENRKANLASTNAILACIGAAGHALLEAPPDVRSTEALRLALKLRDIHWERDKRWDGIAGKMTPKGTLTVAGTKEAAYAVFAAMSDPKSPGFGVVRRAVAQPGASPPGPPLVERRAAPRTPSPRAPQ